MTTVQQWLSLATAVAALMGAIAVAVTQYFHCRRDKRMDAKHEERLTKLESWTE